MNFHGAQPHDYIATQPHLPPHPTGADLLTVIDKMRHDVGVLDFQVVNKASKLVDLIHM